ncbi:hypothetical protein O9G_004858 [Rozella allomycis CSF55]|uniref:Derlin n=1 Tax=Rozella allomycis (strain CSF55) TaxID=988480 RepID=A0A075B2T1_ROZAC|nr:hypothetical protein O9G_004858 [Rozella allomycis CSF55]|eukprot:EPZ36639.1 hypothetical protein O9G_004858 [Rozella allomycis CSF55]
MPSAFTIAILYLWSKLNPNMTVSFLFGITFQAQYLAFAMIALDFLMGGPIMGSLIGVFVCHNYGSYRLFGNDENSSRVNITQSPQINQRTYTVPSRGRTLND